MEQINKFYDSIRMSGAEKAESLALLEHNIENAQCRPGSMPRKKRMRRMIAIAAAAACLLISVIGISANTGQMEGWAFYDQNVNKLDCNLPEAFGEFILDKHSLSTVHIVPDGSTEEEAWKHPIYKSYAVMYDNSWVLETPLPDGVMGTGITNRIKLSVCFNDNDYIFKWLGYDPTEEYTLSSEDLKNFEKYGVEPIVEKVEYRGITINLSNRPAPSKYSGCFEDWDALWYDPELDAAFSLNYEGDSEAWTYIVSRDADGKALFEPDERLYLREYVVVSKDQMLSYAKMLIDANR